MTTYLNKGLSFYLIILLTFLSSCKENLKKDTPEKTQPNIVFILSDDHAQAAISSYGSEIIQTPNIDRIAKNGILFKNTFVVSSLCAPSRAAILNSQYGAKSGFKRIGDIFDGSGNTLPKLLQQGNYQTAIVGKWHLRSKPIGFDHFDIIHGLGRYFDPIFISDKDKWGEDKEDGTVTKGYISNIITDKSLTWLGERDTTKPFALFLNHLAPHAPHITPEEYGGLFLDDLPYPATFDDDFSDNNSSLKNGEQPYSKLENANEFDVYNSLDKQKAPPNVKRGTTQYKEWAYQTMFKGYYRQVTNMDENIGRVLDYLEENDLTKNTIIIYASDNGWFLGDHGLFNKMWMYEESIHIPLIIQYDGITKPNSENDQIISSLDFAPTLLDFANVSIPEKMQGKSFRPILEGKDIDNWRKSFFYHYFDQFDVPEQYGIRTNEYKLIKLLINNKPEYEFYDLINDPKELRNQIDNSEYHTVREELMQRLENERVKYEE